MSFTREMCLPQLRSMSLTEEMSDGERWRSYEKRMSAANNLIKIKVEFMV